MSNYKDKLRKLIEANLTLLKCKVCLPSNTGDTKETVAERILLLNKKYFKEEEIPKKVESILEMSSKQKKQSKRLPFNLDLNNLQYRQPGDQDSTARSVKSMRGDQSSTSSYHSQYKRRSKNIQARNPPKLKFDYMFSSELARTSDLQKEARKAFRDNIKSIIFNAPKPKVSKKISLTASKHNVAFIYRRKAKMMYLSKLNSTHQQEKTISNL